MQKTNRELLVLSRCNEALIKNRSEEDFLNEICQIIIEVGGYKLAWIGFAENDTQKTVRPVAQKGFEDGYLSNVNITWGNDERGQGPTGKAIRTGIPHIIKNILNDPNYTPWREQANKRGYRSSIALPIIIDGITSGALNVYSIEEDAFDDEEIALLMRLANNLASGLSTLRALVERKSAEKGLKQHQDRLEELVLKRTIALEVANKQLQIVTTEINHIFNISIPICLISKNYDLLRFNDTFCTFFKISKEQISGKKCYEIKRNPFCGTPNCTIEKLSQGTELYEYEVEFSGNPDNPKSYIISARPYRSANGTFIGAVECILDITARKKVEDALQRSEEEFRKSEEKFRTLFNSASDSITIYNLEGRFLEVNDCTCQLLGYSKEDLLKMSINDIYSPEYAEITPQQVAEISKQGYTLFETGYKRRDGKVIPIELSSRIIDYLGQKTILSIARDITERKKFENIQKQFISTVSHELRTPISVILQSIGNFQKYSEKLTEDQRKNLINSIIRNSELLAELTNDLLTISQLDAQKVKLEWSSYSPLNILKGVLDQLEPKRSAKAISIELEMDQDIQLFGDPQKIGAIFRIFLDNALKYSANDTKIQIKSTNHYSGKYNSKKIDGLLIEFTDYGRGIRPAEIPYLFNRFFRSDDVRNIPGTGLGLSIALNLAQLHQGEIHVESTYGNGTTFFLFLPFLEKKPQIEN